MPYSSENILRLKEANKDENNQNAENSWYLVLCSDAPKWKEHDGVQT
jgi:hypothetical protein